ncbi:type IV secretion protein Rhs, partial [Xenorhabdus sp. 12]
SAAGGIAAGLLFAAGVAASCLGVGVLLIGAAIAVGMAASALGDKARDTGVSMGASSQSPTGTIETGSPNVFINNKAAAIATRSQVACSKENGIRQMAQGSDSVLINGLPASRVGDKTTCDAAVMTGSPNVTIGGGTKTTKKITPEIPEWAYTASDLTMFAAGLFSFGGAAAKGPGALQKLFSKLPGADKIRKFACRFGWLGVALPVVGILANPVEVIAG